MVTPDPAAHPGRWRRALRVLVVVIVVLLGFAVWYRWHYAMRPARSFELPGSAAGPRVLIATQGSAFKDALVAGLVEHLKSRAAHTKVIDVTALAGVREADWDAIVILHTWEMHKPPAAVQSFVDTAPDRRKLVVLTTSGAGDFRMPGVDAISSASRMIDVPTRVQELDRLLDARLDARSGASAAP